ncbi:MAG: pilus assembly PilX N-terminal domain-containing protein [Chloroherpetonaceae bacterium]|nr:pilus assembly PilX N-terminal domain-containing protein [Chthonomonadaceae bacterium]MDW8206801.1 pilus assembly PilX N-terminal domain-containing protein [Chloroherpetonaceae bacterium]
MICRPHRYMARRSVRGQAFLFALALVTVFTLLVAGAQMIVVQQLKLAQGNRDYERALHMAEAGANAYLNQLSRGFVTLPGGALPNWNPLPTGGIHRFPLDIAQMRERIRDGTCTVTRYPAGSQQGYFVGHTDLTETRATVISYGWSNGHIRRVTVRAEARGIFDWAGGYAINPWSGTDQYGWQFRGRAAVIGLFGGEGAIIGGHRVTCYGGPVLWAGPGAAHNAFPDVLPDRSGRIASSPHLRYAVSLGVPTVDQVASAWARIAYGVTTTQGADFYRTRNHNATGIRYLVRNSVTGAVRELPGLYQVMTPGDYVLDEELRPNDTLLDALGKTGQETFYGLRFYPGDYFFERIVMQPTDRISLRTYHDAERATRPGAPHLPLLEDPANPNPGQANNPCVRFWIGQHTAGAEQASVLNASITLEYPQDPGRFRVYAAGARGLRILGSRQNPPPVLRGCFLCYNRGAGGGYGRVQLRDPVHIQGSVIGWQIDVDAGCTIEHQPPQWRSGEDRIGYMAVEWKELP